MKKIITIAALLTLIFGFEFNAFSQCNFPANDLSWNLYPDGIQNAPTGTSPFMIAGSGNPDYTVASSKGSYFMLNFSSATVGKTFAIGNDAACGGTDDGIPLGTAITIYSQDGTYIADAINNNAGGTHVTFTVSQAGNYWVLFNTANCGANGAKTNEIVIKCNTCTNAPSNDEPYAAVPLSMAAPNTTPTMVAGTTVWATSTYMMPWGYTGPTCASSTCNSGVTAYPNDVWYKVFSFNYTQMEITINAPQQIGTVGLIRVYESSNGYNNFSLHSCVCSPSASTSITNFTVNNIDPNKTYFIAVSPKVGTTGFWTPFSIGVNGDYSSQIVETGGQHLGDGTNMISWSSLEDADVIGYEIEKSAVASEDFSSIGSLDAFGNLEEVKYNFEDKNAQNAMTYYRVKMLYADETHSYSTTIAVNAALKADEISIFPNPATNMINIATNIIAEGGGEINIYDLKGSKMLNVKYNDLQNIAPINISELSDGFYIVDIRMENGETKKLKLNKTQSSY